MKCFAADVPVVSGTTGWLDRIDEVKEMCDKEGKTFFYASNYSIGVNIFFAVNTYLAKIMNNFPSYNVKMTETHHIHKLDAPSGTAITLAEGILEQVDRKDRWCWKQKRMRRTWLFMLSEKAKFPVFMKSFTILKLIISASNMMRRAVRVLLLVPL